MSHEIRYGVLLEIILTDPVFFKKDRVLFKVTAIVHFPKCMQK